MKSLKELVLERVKTYWFPKRGLEGYANPTEPNLYPHGFEAMVKKSEFYRVTNLLEKAEVALGDLMNAVHDYAIKEESFAVAMESEKANFALKEIQSLKVKLGEMNK